jgi:hypothetical protein
MRKKMGEHFSNQNASKLLDSSRRCLRINMIKELIINYINDVSKIQKDPFK